MYAEQRITAINEPADNRSSRFGLRQRVKGVVSNVPGGQFADQFAQRVASHADQVATQVTTRVAQCTQVSGYCCYYMLHDWTIECWLCGWIILCWCRYI